jgi:hypothetical protein
MMRDLETDEAGTDHDGPPRRCCLRDQHPAVRKRAQIVDMRQITARNAEPYRLSTGGQEQRAVADRASSSNARVGCSGKGCFSLRTGEALRAPALNPVPCWLEWQRGFSDAALDQHIVARGIK